MGDLAIFPALIRNAALLLASAFIYDVLTSRHRIRTWPLPIQLLVGALVGLLGIIIMLSPWTHVPGIVFDTRSVLLGIAGLFFGVVPTAVAMAMTALFRLSQGGAAAWTGVAVILTTGTIGIFWRQQRRRPLTELSWRELYLFGLIVHLDMLLVMLTLPWPTAKHVLAHITLPVLAIYPVATMLLGLLMVSRLQREGAASELLAKEERLRLALAAANQGLYDLNVQTGEAQVSPEYATMLGYDPAEFRETNARWIERLHPDDHEPVAATYREYIAGNLPEYRVEFRQRTTSGEWKWILSLGKIVEYDAAGRPLRMLGTHTDITKRKQAEEMLGLFKVLVENASDAIGMSTPEGMHYYQNEAFTALFGNIGEDPPATIYVDQGVGRQIFETVMAGRRWTGEVQMYAKDKRILNIFLRAYANKDQNGRVISLVGIHTDITEQKQAEEALRNNEIFIRTVLDNLPIGIAVNSVEPAVDFTYMNDNFPRFYRTTREALATPDAFWEAVYQNPETRNALKRRVLADCASGNPKRMRWEDVPITRQGEETTYVVAQNTPIPGQGLMISTVLDITERKRAEEEKELLLAQLIHAQKMESVGRLAGGVAHDFNNMLQTILGYCDLTLCELDPQSQLHDNLREIRKAAERSTNLTRQLLAFARKQVATPKVLDLNDTVAGMLKMLQRLIGEDINLVWAPGHALWPVKIDPSQLDQVLANLAINARDAIANTGTISIATENTQLDAAFCACHPECQPGDYVLLSVCDTGCGMDEAMLTQIFEPFFTTKEQGKGTGLGLATVYGVVRQNNGHLAVESAPGQGTTFRLYLPRVAAEAGAALPESVAVTPAGGSETVLIVEDEEAILTLGRSILQLLGYTVLAASSPTEALRLAQAHPAPIHLLITDVIMPEMNGHELAAKLSALRPEMRCLYMSGYTDDIIARQGVLRDELRFLQKPFSVNDLANAVREALA